MSSSAKLPAIQFYPGDWRKDVGVQSLSFHDRGVWFEILMLMHESERRGLLILNGHSMPEEALARVLGLDKQILTTTLTNLLTSGVAGLDEQTGALMCRRMVRDQHLREIRQEAGKKGGNPALLIQKPTTGDKQTPKQTPTTGDKQSPTPSSSSSSSSSESTGGACATHPPLPKPVENQSAEPVLDTAKLEPAMCARGMFETLGIPAPMSTQHLATQAIAMTAKRMCCTPYAAMLVIQRKAELAKHAGETVNRFWFEDGKYEALSFAEHKNVGVYRETAERERIPAEAAPADVDVDAGAVMWANVSKGAAAEINVQSFQTWVKPMRPIGVKDDVLYMRVPSDEFTEVCDRYCDVFAKFLPAMVTVKLLRAEVFAS
jgi:hypothetical protein